MKGSYVLLLELKENKTIQIGKLGKLSFKKGLYAYVGSAFNGLEQRINRHFRKEKRIHWHIDYLLNFAEIIHVFYKEGAVQEECDIARTLNKQFDLTPSFGCSDCKCKSHLFYGSLKDLLGVVKNLGMKQYKLNENT